MTQTARFAEDMTAKMRNIGIDIAYFFAGIGPLTYALVGLGLAPVIAIGAATAVFGVVGTYCSLAIAIAYIVALGWLASEMLGEKIEKTEGDQYG